MDSSSSLPYQTRASPTIDTLVLPSRAVLPTARSEKSEENPCTPPPYHGAMAIAADAATHHAPPPSYAAATRTSSHAYHDDATSRWCWHHGFSSFRSGRFAFYGCCCCLLFVILFVLLFVAILPKLNKI